MKKIYKKLIAAALGVSMLLSMVGCGQSSATDQTQESSEPTQTADESETKADDCHSERAGQSYHTDHEQGK